MTTMTTKQARAYWKGAISTGDPDFIDTVRREFEDEGFDTRAFDADDEEARALVEDEREAQAPVPRMISEAELVAEHMAAFAPMAQMLAREGHIAVWAEDWERGYANGESAAANLFRVANYLTRVGAEHSAAS